MVVNKIGRWRWSQSTPYPPWDAAMKSVMTRSLLPRNTGTKGTNRDEDEGQKSLLHQ